MDILAIVRASFKQARHPFVSDVHPKLPFMLAIR
jgi:hypothetical protein